MGVHLPTAAVGNGRVLCTIGGAGEVMGFFYPSIDFAQNVNQCLPALHEGEPGHGRLVWTFADEVGKRQWCEPGTSVVVTELVYPASGVTVTFRDCVPPGTDALVRRISIRASGDRGFVGSLQWYWELRLQEVTGKQSVRFSAEDGAMVQYFRDTAIAVGGRRADLWRCGKSIDDGPRSAKNDMLDGHLNGQPEDIGQVDFALGWVLELEPAGEAEFDVCVSAGTDREAAQEQLRRLCLAGGAELERRTKVSDAAWLASLRQVEADGRWTEPYQRALLSVRMLQDAGSGAVVAAPEFDPSYEACGGYGYCWPRDATEAAMALEAAGDTGSLEALNRWYLRAQLGSGHWGQRYWTDGRLASSWSLREDFLQIDQTAAAVIALAQGARDSCRRGGGAVPADVWTSLSRGADALMAMVGPDGWHSYACDLWETCGGRFTYSSSALHAALRDAATIAELQGDAARAQRWSDVSRRIKSAVMALHTGEYFPRGLLGDGQPDMVVDSSTLGVSEPFGLLDPRVTQERALIETNLAVIEERLRYTMADGSTGIRRYEGDGYLGGVIGCVNTLWFALVCLQLATACRAEDARHAAEMREKAEGYLEFCLRHASPSGMLPELIGIYPEYPYWAAPHSWASGLMVKCVLELEAANGRDR